jgi:PRTRC genetic system protein C
MAITTNTLERGFLYNGVSLPDPGSNLTVEEVRDVYSAAYPEILTSSIEGPEKKGDKLVYTFRKAAGGKG